MNIELCGWTADSECKAALKQRVLDLFGQGRVRLAPNEIKQMLSVAQPSITKHQLNAAVRELVSSGALIYTSHYSISHLEINHSNHVKIGNRLLLTSDVSRGEDPGIAVVRISSGASFGMGDHATTRLALQLIEYVLTLVEKQKNLSRATVLDIGTGTGVLAIAAVQLGAGRALGLDINAISRHEAAANVRLNHLQDRIAISGKSLEELDIDIYDLLIANLRPPTLRRIFPLMRKMSTKGSFWVLSGFRPDEGNSIERQLTTLRFRTVSKLEAENWCGFAVQLEI